MESADAAMAALASRDGGLSETEAANRLQRHGPNALPAAARRSPLARLLGQFNNALIYFLLAAAGAAWVLGHLVDAWVILAVVLINAIVGFIQEGKAERALDAIRLMIAPTASVRRDGRRRSLPVTELVPGDIVLLEAGDQVAADVRLLNANALVIDEAILTGESVPAEKRTAAVAAGAQLGDRSCMAYSGTLVAAGSATGIAVATGSATEIGRISRLIGEVTTITTPLLQQINRFGRYFTLFAALASLLIFTYATLFRSYPWDEALLLVVALAVGVIPEGLPAIITITLAMGVQRMAARHAIVRRLPAVETLGATSIICSDKTGTLTRNEMTVRRVITADHEVLVEGIGYAPTGGFRADEANIAALPPVTYQLARAALLCNDAQLIDDGGNWRVEGDPMEGALVALAMKAELDPVASREQWLRIDEIPFDAQHRFMATLHRCPEADGGDYLILVKGAPERVLAMCSEQASHTGAQPVNEEYWEERIGRAAAQGERVLGFAYKFAPTTALSHAHIESDLILLGIAGFIDPPRAEAVAAIAECHAAGIGVKMITGDHGLTAAAIARQLGLGEHPEIVTGAELDELADDALRQVAARGTVFARTNPEHKLRIVRALQAKGDIVAMTGDGVNDAPALKQANVGVAMGRKGTEAAKQAAEMVLVDDNFATIVAAVHEGRTVFDNIRKVVTWTLPTNGGEALTLLTALFLGMTLPLTAVQILWINMVTTITLGLVLAFEPAEPGVMQRPPRAAKASLLTPFLLWRVVLVSLLFVAGSFTVFNWSLAQGLGVETARTLVVNAIVVMEIFYLFNVRYLHMSSINWRGVLGTPVILAALAIAIAAQLLFTYAPFMHTLLDTRPVPLSGGLLVIGVGVALLLLLELEKNLMRRSGLMQRLAN